MTDLKNFAVTTDSRGTLVALESFIDIPFDIKRVYYIYNTSEGTSRGYHAHKNLQQIAICISGSCKFILDNGDVKQSVILNSPSQGLYIGSNTWREMHDFSENCILLVLASDVYNEDDYIRNYDEFLDYVKC